MKLTTIKSEGLAHNSYYLSSDGEAVVVDPRRDCEIYTQIAAKDCSKIKYILETHRNEDYVIGSLELQNMTEAEIGHSKMLPFKYGELNLSDEDTLNVGPLRIKALYTPGHTNESLCYAVYTPEISDAMMVFSGDTLFLGSIGRTDLYGKDKQQTQAEKLYESLHSKLLPLGDHVLVYPSHGEGSICGHGIKYQEPTTIGFEKKTNPYLKLNKEDLIRKVQSENLVVPRYFHSMEELNLNGPPLLSELAYPKALPLDVFEGEMGQHNLTVIDTRKPYSYAGSHIPGSLSIWLNGTSVYSGWILNPDQYVILILESPLDIDSATSYLRRLGFDNLCGYLCGGMNTWQEAGKSLAKTGTTSVIELKEKFAKQEVILIDVREPLEWKEDGYIEGAKLITFPDIPVQAQTLPRDKPIAITCSVGNRASIAVSLLEKLGFKDVSNVLGGMTAWMNLGFPVKKEV